MTYISETTPTALRGPGDGSNSDSEVTGLGSCLGLWCRMLSTMFRGRGDT